MAEVKSAPRQRDRQATEAAIVSAAERLLLDGGWTALNVNTLAAAAGVDRKLIYRYFDGVDGVVERLAGSLDLWLGETLAALPPTQARSYRDFAREMLTGYLSALRANPLILRLLAWELAEDTPLLRLAPPRSAAAAGSGRRGPERGVPRGRPASGAGRPDPRPLRRRLAGRRRLGACAGRAGPLAARLSGLTRRRRRLGGDADIASNSRARGLNPA
jgi:AcrR family transcriptional regulator